MSVVTPQALSALKEQREQLLSTIDAILEENAALSADLASRSVALMVPGMDDNDDLVHIIKEAEKDLDCGRIALNAWIVKHANPIPTSSIIKDGELVVRVDILSAMEGCIAALRADAELIPSKALDYLDSIRSKGGEP